jgi:hypothetical protein
MKQTSFVKLIRLSHVKKRKASPTLAIPPQRFYLGRIGEIVSHVWLF